MKKLRTIEVQEISCRTCSHRWFPRIRRESGEVLMPKNCSNPRCKSPYWNVPYSKKR